MWRVVCEVCGVVCVWCVVSGGAPPVPIGAIVHGVWGCVVCGVPTTKKTKSTTIARILE